MYAFVKVEGRQVLNPNLLRYINQGGTLEMWLEMQDKMQEVSHRVQEIKASYDADGNPLRPSKPVKVRKKTNHSWYKFR